MKNSTHPPIADLLFFGAVGSSGTTVNDNLASNSTFTSITFNATSSAYTIGGNAINPPEPSPIAWACSRRSTSTSVAPAQLRADKSPSRVTTLLREGFPAATTDASTLARCLRLLFCRTVRSLV